MDSAHNRKVFSTEELASHRRLKRSLDASIDTLAGNSNLPSVRTKTSVLDGRDTAVPTSSAERPAGDSGFDADHPARPWCSASFERHLNLWIAAIIIFGFANGFTTAMAFAAGVRDPNFIMGTLAAHNFGLLAYSVVSTVVLLVFFLISYRWNWMTYIWLIPLGLCLIGALLVISNIVAFIQVVG